MSQAEIEQLRDRITHLEALIARMTAGDRIAPAADSEPKPDVAETDLTDADRTDVGATDAGTSRRGLLRAAAVAAGAAMATTVVSADPAAAADGDPLLAGNWTIATSLAEHDYTGTTPGAGFLFQSGTTLPPGGPAFSGRPAALTGATTRGLQPTGVLGYSEANPGTGVWGYASSNDSIGVRGQGATAIHGVSTTSTGTGYGQGNAGYGVRGVSTDAIGVIGNSTNSIGVFGAGTTGVRGDGATEGLRGEGLASGNGVVGNAAGAGSGVLGTSVAGSGVRGTTSGNAAGVSGSAPSGYGVSGEGYYGVMGTSTTGYGVFGDGIGGVVAAGTQYAFVASTADSAALYLRSTRRTGGAPRVAPPSRSDAHVQGEVDVDGSGDLWLCVADGTPGTWRKLSGASTAGAFHAITPGRVYDSRLAVPGPAAPLAAGAERTVSVRDRRSTVDGSVTLADLVPVGATAIAANVTVVDTVGAGFLTANPGGVHEIGAATINWSASGQILNNGVILTLDANRELNVIAGGSTGAATHVVIDVTGYYR